MCAGERLRLRNSIPMRSAFRENQSVRNYELPTQNIMKCPTCTETDLVMSDRQGVEIDYCPKCRGVWLDRGELDKIIERSSSTPAARAEVEPPRSSLPPYGYPTENRHGDHDDHGDHGEYRGRHRKGSWLRELFD